MRANGKRLAGVDCSYSPRPLPPSPSSDPSRGSFAPPLLLVRVRSHLRSPVVVPPLFARGRGSTTTRQELFALACRCRAFVCAWAEEYYYVSGVVCARLSSSRLCSRIGGGVLLHVRSGSRLPVVFAPSFARARGNTTTCFGSRRIDRTSHLHRGCRADTTSSTKLFAPHAFYTQSRSP
jgi:hypothetical protein